ncbi:hypothetical protein NXS98_13840 [Fontisphaera persica]|nr:hypothetical protein [Fontisphaera persica]WCJ58791.1 hypothetical protein NXS98_13840 [Fontisphaera persica]
MLALKLRALPREFKRKIRWPAPGQLAAGTERGRGGVFFTLAF